MSSLSRAVKQEIHFLEQLLVHAGLREAYYFAKNSWGMIVHPSLTTARVWGNRHYTQMFLVFGFPFNLWLLITFVGALVIWLGQPGPIWRARLLLTFSLLTILLLILAVYYVSWIWRYRCLRRKQVIKQRKAK